MLGLGLALTSPQRRGFSPSALFANGEIGDLWRFDADNTNATVVTDPVNEATGLVNSRVMDDLDPAGSSATLVQVNGNFAAQFDAGSDLLYHNFGSTVVQPGTIILCLGDSDVTTHVLATGSSAALRWQISNDGSDNIIAFAGATLDSTINAPIGTKVLAAVFNGASSVFRVNGVQVATGNAGTQGTDRLTLGALYDGTFAGTVNFYSAMFINRLLTAPELDGAERLLGSHAGLSW